MRIDTLFDRIALIGTTTQRSFLLGDLLLRDDHVRKPWVFAENVQSLTRCDGCIYVTIPWVWRYHGYPDDYFRFPWRGIMELFALFSWSAIEYSANVSG